MVSVSVRWWAGRNAGAMAEGNQGVAAAVEAWRSRCRAAGIQGPRRLLHAKLMHAEEIAREGG